jgi:hypothetical protein
MLRRERTKKYIFKKEEKREERDGGKYINKYNPQLDSLGGAESNYRLRTKRGKTSPGTPGIWAQYPQNVDN